MELRPYQRHAIDSLYNYFEARSGNPLIVIPTGGGKSVVIAKFAEEVMKKWPHQRILVLAHRKELLEQNAEKIRAVWPEAPVGIYSAGLNKRELGKGITVAGIQSVANKGPLLGWFSLVLVDECHLIPRKGQGQYLRLLNKLKEVNSRLKVIGFTATPYRLDSGALIEGKNKIFTDICYNSQIGDMIKAGYLSPLTSKVSTVKADLTGVRIRGKEYVAEDLEKAMSKGDIISRTAEQINFYGQGRDSWLIFCTGVYHAGLIKTALENHGVSIAVVTGDTPREERAQILKDFKNKKIRAIANCEVLTTGFDAPNIDLLVMLRPTKSTGLYVQMVGRGSRLAPGKVDCMVLDFAGNIGEHGPITDIILNINHRDPNGKKVTVKKNTAGFKVCEVCQNLVDKFATHCSCGHAFEIQIKHLDKPLDMEIVHTPMAEWIDVEGIDYDRHYSTKEGKPDSLVVTYKSGLSIYREWVCINHTGYPRDKALAWVMNRTKVEDLDQITLENLLTYNEFLKIPAKIKVRKAGKYYEVVDYDFA